MSAMIGQTNSHLPWTDDGQSGNYPVPERLFFTSVLPTILT